MKFLAAAACLALVAAPSPAAGFDWNKQANRILIARALSRFSNFCADAFHFERRPVAEPIDLEKKVNSHLLLSPYPDGELEKWAEWIPYADSSSDVYKFTISRGADALLAARSDPSAGAAAKKLWIDTYRGVLETAFAKCRAGAADPFIAEQFYSGQGNAGGIAETAEKFGEGFEESVRSLDKPTAKAPPRKAPVRAKK